jgi:hypothetical protein
MLTSVLGVSIFFGYNLSLVLKKEKDKRKLHSTLDKTPDMNNNNNDI